MGGRPQTPLFAGVLIGGGEKSISPGSPRGGGAPPPEARGGAGGGLPGGGESPRSGGARRKSAPHAPVAGPASLGSRPQRQIASDVTQVCHSVAQDVAPGVIALGHVAVGQFGAGLPTLQTPDAHVAM